MRLSAVLVIAACGLLAIPAATAKDFRPGDVRVCGRSQCAPIVGKRLLRTLTRFYWGPGTVHRAAPVRRGAAGFVLRWRNGFASGLVAGDRFRANGFYCGRFRRGQWYRVPAAVAAALRKLTGGMTPMRVYPPPPSR